MRPESSHSTRSHSDFGRNRLGLEGRSLIVLPLDRPTSFDVLINGNVLFPPGLLLGGEAHMSGLGDSREVQGPEDWDMLIRLSRFGYLAFVDEVIFNYRRHGSNMGETPGIEFQAWLVRCKGFYSPDNDAVQQRSARRGWRAYQRYMTSQRCSSARDDLRAKRPGPAVGQIARIPVPRSGTFGGIRRRSSCVHPSRGIRRYRQTGLRPQSDSTRSGFLPSPDHDRLTRIEAL